jgi:glutamate formiminotransferase/formiminotetrahydrofolate cyclodeaminase
MSKVLIECVPNFSEGRDINIINQITAEIQSVDEVMLLNVDPGKATNRTVVTFVGPPEQVITAAYKAIVKAGELIDMSKHKGEHPRMGATDVCPLIPISGITMEETVVYAKKLAKLIGDNTNIPVYLYEYAATTPERKNLANIRAGEYEGLNKKIIDPEWKPDYGAATFNAKSGATVIGARDFLVAYNINLNTKSVKKANSVAFDVREAGRVKKKGDVVLKDENGEPLREAGKLKHVKGIGWYIEEYGVAQVSMNLTNIQETPLHIAFEECCNSATARGMRVTGSELVGLVPKSVLTNAGKYFLEKQGRSAGVSEEELIFIAIKTLGLDELSPFDPKKRIIEYLLNENNSNLLVNQTLESFANNTASESPAPGGGSISAYVGTLGAALGTMVANLSAGKAGWEKHLPYFSEWAVKGQGIKEALLHLVDEDTNAFNKIMDAFKLPKNTEDEKSKRTKAISDATKYAIEVPLKVMNVSFSAFDLLEDMARKGNPNSASDTGVGALCILTAMKGAYLNVLINCKDFDDEKFVSEVKVEAETLIKEAEVKEQKILEVINDIINGFENA